MTDWQSEIEELRRRRTLAAKMGGEEKIARQHDAGRLTIRERIDRLLDAGSFDEVGGLAGKAAYDENDRMVDFMASNQVMGRGLIEGRPVVVAGDDFTIRGGAADAAIHRKMVQSELMARDLRLPIVRLIDGTGGGGSIKVLEREGRTYVPFTPGWEVMAENLGVVPVVGLALGSVAGLGALRAAACHYSLMVQGTSQIFVAGPPVAARAGEVIDKEGLGGAALHGVNGTVDDAVESEEEAFERTRRFLSYLPSSVHELAERVPTGDPVDRREDWLIGAIPRDRRRVYKVRPIIEAVVDRGSFFEIGKGWGRSAITGLARLDGWPVGVLAGDPRHYGGAWTADASDKVTRFVDLAQTFHLPIVHFVDNPGFAVGSQFEAASTIRRGARTAVAVYQATVPFCSIILRKVFGVAGAMHMNHTRYMYRYSWPSGDWGSLPVEGGIEAAYKSELAAAPDPAARLAEIEAKLERMRSPFRTAEDFMVEDIIDPRETRPLLCRFAHFAARVRVTGESRFAFRP